MTLSDAQLHAIYHETIDALYGYISRRCGGERALAEDLTQETWLRAVREWYRNGVPDRPIAWLTTVARNLIISHYRRRAALPLEHPSADAALAVLDAGEVQDSVEVAALVNSALARLPAGQTRLLEAFHFDRQRVAEIAEVAGTSERAVEGRLRRARANLRKELEKVYTRNGGAR